MSDEALNGADYRAVTRLSNGDDDVTYAAIGETCERVPVDSLPGLLTHGYIEPVQPPPQRREGDGVEGMAERVSAPHARGSKTTRRA